MSEDGMSTRSSGRYPSLNLHSVKRHKFLVYAWGRGDLGQLGRGKEGNELLPIRIEAFDGKDLSHFAGNVYNTAAVTNDGDVYVMGNNDAGQLAVKNRENRFMPLRVEALDVHIITNLAFGQQHALAINEKGTLLSWGDAEFGQLGQGDVGVSTPIPRVAKVGKSGHFIRCAGGASYSLGLMSNGQVFSCGQGTYGALGHGDDHSIDYFRPIQSIWHIGVVQIACGENHSAALTAYGQIYTWGRGKYGQLGLGDFTNANQPRAVKSLLAVKGAQIACGGDHTLLMGNRGEVYSWGRGTWGQTGLGVTDNFCRPVKIQGLEDEYIIQISAGSRHSLALARRGAVFSFGNGEQGQLGLGTTENHLSPQEVKSLPPLPVAYVLAAGDHSIAVLDEEPPEDVNSLASINPWFGKKHGEGLRAVRIPNLLVLTEAVAKSGSETGDEMMSLLDAIEDIFSSPGFLISGFSKPGRPTSPHDLHLDIVGIRKVYESMLKLYKNSVITVLGNTCIELLDHILAGLRWNRGKSEQQDVEAQWLKCLVVLLLSPLLGETQGQGGAMVGRIADVVASLTQASKQLLMHWLGSLPVEFFGGQVVGGVQKHLSRLSAMHDPTTNPMPHDRRTFIMKVSQLLALLHRVNVEIGEPVLFNRFYNAAVSRGVNLKEEYLRWSKSHKSGDSIVSICHVPFILTPDAKSKIIQSESLLQKQLKVQQSQIEAWFQGIHPGLVTFLDIRVRRDHIMEDSLNQIVQRQQDLKKPLRVTFVSNDVAEEGQDEGGLSKEFFQLLVQEIFKPDYGMFTYDDETRTFWFNPQSLESTESFQLVGIVLGLAIYNNVILDVHFPLVVYKKLLNVGVGFKDLKQAMPELGKGLQQLLDFEGDVENTFCRTFEVEYDFFGEMKTHELKPGGKDIAVTCENRKEYVELYSNYILEESIRTQFDPFVHGFLQVCGGPALTLFRYEELELLVCGLPHLDFSELKRGAKYDGGYHPNHPVVNWFWEIVNEMALDKKKRFLAFSTGCDRAPVGGLSQLTLTIQMSGPDSERLPSAHTCFNVLLVPEYSSKPKLQQKLTQAIENAQGFGLQ